MQRDKEEADLVVRLEEEAGSVVVAGMGLRGRLWAHAPGGGGQGGVTDRALVLALGLNPAVQRTIRMDGVLRVGDVNRAASASVGIGGKGQNFR